MKKLKTILKFLFAFLGGVALGLTILIIGIMLFSSSISLDKIREGFASVNWAEIALVALVAMVAVYVSNVLLVVIHEGGHLVAGLLSGYKFVSFRIFNYVIIRKEGKVRVKKYHIAGTAGQCLLAPPERPISEIPVGWYLAGGVLANVLVFVAVLPLMWLHMAPILKMVCAIFLLMDFFMIIINGVPMRVQGFCNDALDMIMLRKSPVSNLGMINQLRCNALIQNGTRPKDLPSEWFVVPGEIDYRKPFEVSIPLAEASRKVDDLKFEEAIGELETLYAHRSEIMPLYVKEIKCELAFLYLATGRIAEAEGLMDDELMAYMRSTRNVMSSRERFFFAIALYKDGDRDKALEINEGLKGRAQMYLLQGEVLSDIAIMEKCIV